MKLELLRLKSFRFSKKSHRKLCEKLENKYFLKSGVRNLDFLLLEYQEAIRSNSPIKLLNDISYKINLKIWLKNI